MNIFNPLNLVNTISKYIVSLIVCLSFLFSPILIAEQQHGSVSKGLSVSIQKPIRIVMSAAFVSDSGIEVYNDIFKYLGTKLEREIEFISGFSYEAINAMLDTGMVDVGFICGLPYTIKKDQVKPSVKLLLAPVMKNPKYKDKPIYYSNVIVHKDSKFNNFQDLKGSHFAFSDELSNSGYNMPRAHLVDIGETSGFFSKVSHSGSHEESIRMIALGMADVSAVDSLVYDYDVMNNFQYTSQTKVIKVLGPVGIPPIVVSNKISLSLRNEIREILLDMKNDIVGRKVLDEALLDRFTIVKDSNYDSIRKMNKKATAAHFKVIR